jgi:hypothetical protein
MTGVSPPQENAMPQPPAPPIPYTPSVEQPVPDEPATSQALNDTLHAILETTAADDGHAVRAVHAKSHGLIEATLTILPDLPPDHAQGLFARPGEHPAVLRFSAIPGDVLDDAIGLPKGLALKEALLRRIDDGMRFSVWTGLQAHRPLGAVNRVRRSAYEMSADFRGRVGGYPMREPV